MFFASFKLIFSAFSLTTSTKIWQNLKNKMIICDFYTSIVMLRKHRTSLEKIKKNIFRTKSFYLLQQNRYCQTNNFSMKVIQKSHRSQKKSSKNQKSPKKNFQKNMRSVTLFFRSDFLFTFSLVSSVTSLFWKIQNIILAYHLNHFRK